MKILITGIDGFLGKKLFSSLGKEYDTYGTSRRIIQQSGNIHPLDILDKNKSLELIIQIQPQILIHNAAIVNVEKCEEEKKLAYDTHVTATKNLAEICQKSDIKMIYFSTDYVFSGKDKEYGIDSKKNPINYYGETKSIAEDSIKSIMKDYLIIRPGLLYGFNDINDKKNLVLDIIKKLKNGEEIVLENNRIRYPLVIDDVSRAVGESINANYQGILHISGTEGLTKYEFGQKIAEVFNLPNNKIIGKDLNEPNRPYHIKLLNCWPGALSLIQGLNLVKKQIERYNHIKN